MRKDWLIVLGLCFVALTSEAQSAAATTCPVDPQQAIVELGDPRFAVRERASNYLLQRGAAIEPLLAKAVEHPDPEVSDRAKQILQDFSLGVLPATPPIVTELLGNYLHGDVTQKEIALNQLSRQGGFGNLIVLRLSQEELDAAVRQKADELGHLGLTEIQRTASELVGASRPELARQLLESAAMAGDATSTRALASMLLNPGSKPTLAETILRFERAGFAETAVGERLKVQLILLKRAAGGLPQAIEAAQTVDPQLAWELAVEAGQWRQVGDMLNQISDFLSPPQRLAITATTSRFSGDAAGCAKNLSDLRNIGQSAQPPLFLALVLNDRPKEAADVLAEEHDDLNAFSLFTSSGHYDAAIALAKRTDIPAEQQDALRVRVAILQASLGHPEAAINLCDELTKKVAVRLTFNELLQLCLVEHRLTTMDAAWEPKLQAHLLAALNVVGLLDNVPELLSIALPHADIGAATIWWRSLTRLHSMADVHTRLQCVKTLVNHKMPADGLQQLALELMQQPTNELELQTNLRQLLGEELTRLGRNDLAKQYITAEIAHYEKANEWSRAGRIALANQCWSQAAEDLAKSPEVTNRWLRGWALAKQGDGPAGQALMDQTNDRILADDKERNELGFQMQLVGQDQLAANRYAQLTRTAEPGSWAYCVACQQLGDIEFGQGHWGAAVEHWRRYMLMQFVFNAVFDDFGENIEFPRAVHEAQARAALTEGKDADALEQARQMLAVNPIKIDPIIALSKQLRAFKPALARGLFDVGASRILAMLKEYPNDGLLHNNLAWLCTECGYEPGLALEHAKRAVELEPRDTDGLDTMAVVCFRNGDRAAAVKWLDRCREVDPEGALWAQRGKEFSTTQP